MLLNPPLRQAANRYTQWCRKIKNINMSTKCIFNSVIFALTSFLMSCSKYQPNGIYRDKNLYESEFSQYGVDYFRFTKNNKEFIFKSGMENDIHHCSGKYRQSNDTLILKSDININSLPIQLIKLKEKDPLDSLRIKLVLNNTSPSITYFLKSNTTDFRQIETKDTLEFKLTNEPQTIRIKAFKKITSGYGSREEYFYSDSLKLSPDLYSTQIIDFYFSYSDLVKYKTLDDFRLIVKSKNRLFSPKDGKTYIKVKN